jgi:hypothetical protein
MSYQTESGEGFHCAATKLKYLMALHPSLNGMQMRTPDQTHLIQSGGVNAENAIV